MRLRDIQDIINNHSKLINLKSVGISNDSQNRRVNNVAESLSSLKEIEKTNLFIELFDEIRNIDSFYLASNDSITLPVQLAQDLIKKVDDLKRHLNIFNGGISYILPEQNPFSIVDYHNINPA